MSAKSLFLFSVACVILASLDLVRCKKNPGRLISCWPQKLKYQKFHVDMQLTTNKRNETSEEESIFGKDIDYDPRRRTTVIVHGFMSTANDAVIKALANQFLEWKDMNVISVSWEKGYTNPLYYHQAVINTEYVALSIQRWFSHTIKLWKGQNQTLDSWGPLHFIGQSIGAHIVGQAAALLKEKENLEVDRVTALDPAEPCFEDIDMPLRLNRTNARFVDVIHTNGARSRNEAFGLLDPIGHADFYVNGGSRQPGCNILRVKRETVNYSDLLLHSLLNGHCHHVRAIILFIESLKQTTAKQCKFWAHPWRLDNTEEQTKILQEECDEYTCPELGINAELFNHYDKKNNNIYYVATTGRMPYCDVIIE